MFVTLFSCSPGLLAGVGANTSAAHKQHSTQCSTCECIKFSNILMSLEGQKLRLAHCYVDKQDRGSSVQLEP